MSLPRPFRLLSPALLGLLATALQAQSVQDPVVPAGHLRLSGVGWFTTAHERGFDPSIPLGTLYTRDSAAELFPGTDQLRSLLAEALAADASDFPLRLGASSTTVTESVTRVPLSAEVGVLDWLTVRVTVPLVRTRAEGTFEVGGDPDADLGRNPGIDNRALVVDFVSSVDQRQQEAAALAADRCAAEPGSAGCLDAQALAAELEGAESAFTNLFGASLLFPAAGTATGDALLARVAELDGRLQAQGLGGLADLPLAGAVADRQALEDLLTDPAGAYGYLSGPGGIGGLWEMGDVEAGLAVRVLDGARNDSTGEGSALAWRLAALGGIRLGTAPERLTHTLLLPRGDDGQTDLYVGGYGAVARGRLGVRARVLVTRQQPGEVRDRIRSPDAPFAPSSSLTLLEWDPGDEVEVEVQPAFRLAPALSLALIWRSWSHGEDRYTRVGPLPAPPDAPADPLEPRVPAETDPTALAVGTERSHQEIGGSLTYRTTELPGAEGAGFEVFVEVRRAVTGSGDYTRAITRASFGGRFMWRLWGGDRP